MIDKNKFASKKKLDHERPLTDRETEIKNIRKSVTKLIARDFFFVFFKEGP